MARWVPWVWWALAACGRPPEDSATTRSGTTAGSTLTTTDTGSWSSWCSEPGLGPATGKLRVTGDEGCDALGFHLDMFDANGDGLAEVAIAEPWYYGDSFYGDHGQAHLLRGVPPASGTAESVAALSVKSTRESLGSGWASGVLLLDDPPQLGVNGLGYDVRASFHVFDYTLSGSVDSDAASGSVVQEPPHDYWLLRGDDNERCPDAAGVPAVCLSGTDAIAGAFDFSGIVVAFATPIVGPTPTATTALRLWGDPGDSAREIHGELDLTGDGLRDLAVGGYLHLGVGSVGVVESPAPFEGRLWDVAAARRDGVTPGAEFGLSVSGGDLDGDGYDDLVVGAPIGDGDSYAFAGPLTGEATAATATWRFAGDVPVGWFGYESAWLQAVPGGNSALAIGAPRHAYDPDALPGRVYLFADPAPGQHGPSDATWTLSGDDREADSFGRALEAGELDGDGLTDLVVGAPRDSTFAPLAGAAFFFLGADLP